MKNLSKAVEILRAGGLVAFPTETVYGLGADAKNPAAVAKIFSVKGRPADHPVIVHLAAFSELSEWVVDDISFDAKKLAAAFWPGPLTLIFKKNPGISALLTGGQDTIGIRIPHHPVALELLREFGGGLAAPSANRFGHISPTTAAAVYEELGDSVDLILEGGQCEVGLESTILDVSSDVISILRPGMIGAKQIEKILGKNISLKQKKSPRVSGSLESHYAPRTKTILLSADEIKNYLSREKKLVVIAISEMKLSDVEYFQMSSSPEKYAHDLYFILREFDKKNFDEIIIEKVPDFVEWDAVRDRLQRAAG